jgi:hypothetical protein
VVGVYALKDAAKSWALLLRCAGTELAVRSHGTG